MLLPIGDEPNDPQTTAWMNHALIGVNVLVFAVLLFQPRGEVESLLARWAYAPRDPSALTLLTSMFLHAGFLHLLGNMLFLWMFGDNIEVRLGPWAYLAAYLLVGAVATLVHGLGADQPVIGASGAVSGVLGMYFVACGRHRVRLLLWLYFFITVLHVNARIVVLFWFVLQDVIPTVLQLRG
ncbi:MAG: rhomboid family intramembrane serine protease, partial [Planctomycetota bacterium]|nr:rhomboid family intramembrane serine protease [Planctomycetota bacterium]